LIGNMNGIFNMTTSDI